MDSSFSFNLSKEKPLSKLCLAVNLTTFDSACRHVKQIPYGRISDKYDLSLVLSENKGTCSTKHAFLAQIAIENDIHSL